MLRNFVHCTDVPKIGFARRLRKDQTSGEKVLWRRLRAKRFHGIKFRRQVPLGPYIVDFLCVEKRLVIEIDGGSHFEPGAKKKDARREQYIRAQGFDVLRFGNGQMLEDGDVVLNKIGRVLGLYEE